MKRNIVKSKYFRPVVAVVLIGIVGLSLLALSRAATSAANIEPELGTIAGSAKVVNDTNASNAKGVQFGSATAVSRFPGDPNPKVTGKAYFGASGENLDTLQASAGKSVSISRRYAPEWGREKKIIEDIKEAHAKNRLPWISTKTPGWAALASGAYDAQLDALLRDMDAEGKPVWFTVHHEAERDSTATGDLTPANYRAMQKHVRDRMTAVGTENIAFMPILQGHSWARNPGWDVNEFWVPGIWDVIGFDHYSGSADDNLLRQRYYDSIAWIEAKGLPYAIGEWGVRDYGNPAQSAQEMRDFWNWGFANNKDALGYSYFDSNLHTTGETWELAGIRLNTWVDILKNDTRVMRINELPD